MKVPQANKKESQALCDSEQFLTFGKVKLNRCFFVAILKNETKYPCLLSKSHTQRFETQIAHEF